MLNPSQMTQEQRCQSFSVANLEKKEFYSPLYPNNYPNNTECILRLEGMFLILLLFDCSVGVSFSINNGGANYMFEELAEFARVAGSNLLELSESVTVSVTLHI